MNIQRGAEIMKTRNMVMIFLTLAWAIVLIHDSYSFGMSSGQTIYVPVYSSIKVGHKGSHFDLAATLCIRNTDMKRPITVVSVDYHGSDGKLLRHFPDTPKQLAPLASTEYFIGSADVSGGLSPSFIVKWTSDAEVNEPIIEAVMIGDKSGQGISFVSTGKVIMNVAR